MYLSKTFAFLALLLLSRPATAQWQTIMAPEPTNQGGGRGLRSYAAGRAAEVGPSTYT